VIIKTLWMQRICDYEGQYAPELLVAVDEYSYDDNPDWFLSQCAKEREILKDDADSFAVIHIHVSQDLLSEAFKPRDIDAVAVHHVET
jgi:hypothetical protein